MRSTRRGRPGWRAPSRARRGRGGRRVLQGVARIRVCAQLYIGERISHRPDYLVLPPPRDLQLDPLVPAVDRLGDAPDGLLGPGDSERDSDVRVPLGSAQRTEDRPALKLRVVVPEEHLDRGFG